jgi:hypothetical protein
MQSNDVIEVVPLSGGSEVILFLDVTAVLAGNCGCIGGTGPPSGIYHR